MSPFRLSFFLLGVLGPAVLGCKDKGECVDPRRGMQGCCSGHGGGEKCGEGRYRFQGDHLICDDGTLSDTCRRSR